MYKLTLQSTEVGPAFNKGNGNATLHHVRILDFFSFCGRISKGPLIRDYKCVMVAHTMNFGSEII